MKLSPTQQKLYNRIKEVSSEMKLKAEKLGEDFDGKVGEEYLKSPEFGYNKVRKQTALALAKSGLAHVFIMVSRHEVVKTYSFGRESHYNVAIELSFEFKLIENKDEKPVVEKWCEYSADGLDAPFIRKEGNLSVFRFC